MENITFCIPYYGKEPHHTTVLEACVRSIRAQYPENPIFVCKTSDSHMPDLLSYTKLDVHTTFVDGSHIIGAIELLIRECKTSHYIIVHDSMFLLKKLPESILELSYYSLWHFNNYRDNYPIAIHLADYAAMRSEDDRADMYRVYETGFGLSWYGIFGPAFGGHMASLDTIWRTLNIGPENVTNYLGRDGIMMCERYIAIIVTYLGFDTKFALNGSIFEQPQAFDVSTVPDNLAEVGYDGYFYKIWQGR